MLLVLLFGMYTVLVKWLRVRDKDEWIHHPLWIKSLEEWKNPHNYGILINQPELCHNEEIDLLIMVSSAPKHNGRRNAIRSTWASKTDLKQFRTKVLFLVGLGNDSMVQSELIKESVDRGDIIQEDFVVSAK